MNPSTEMPVFLTGGFHEKLPVVPLHVHDGIEFIYITHGRCILTVEDSLTLEAGVDELLLLPPGRPHRQLSSEDTRSIYVSCRVSPALLDDTARVISLKTEPCIKRWLTEICDLNAQGHAQAVRPISGLLYALACRLHDIEAQRKDRDDLHPALCAALDLLDKNIAAQWTLAALAREAGVSPSYLSALFKQRFDTGPLVYFQERKLRRAEQLLRDSYLSIKEVGYLCGYEDPNYFSRRFRRRFGRSPTDQRKNPPPRRAHWLEPEPH